MNLTAAAAVVFVFGLVALVAEHRLAPADMARIVVHTFEAATRLTVARPADTEQAQYSLPYPVAAALVEHGITPSDLRVEQPTLEDVFLKLTGHSVGD